MKKLLWILFVLTIITGCTTQKRCAKLFPPQTETIYSYIETIKKDTIVLKPDSLIIIRDVPCDDFDVLVENNALRAQISVLKGKMTASIVKKADTVYIEGKEVKITEYVKEVVTVKECPKITKYFAWIGIGSLLIIITYFVLKYKK